MSLLPMLFSNWWEDLDRPHRITDQYFGLPLSAIAPPDSDILVVRPSRRQSSYYHPYERSLTARRSGGGVSTVQADKDKFLVSLDVQQFSPEEVSVKVVGRNVVIEGKHEEKQDEHGFISRQFVRKYLVPEQCDIDRLQSNLSSDGVLSIEAPRKSDPKNKNERVIPIHKTGLPAVGNTTSESRNVENHKEQQNSQKTPTRVQDKNTKSVKAA